MKKSELRKKAEDILKSIALLENEYKEYKNERDLKNEAVTKIEKELEKIKSYIGNYITLIRKLPAEDPPLLPPPASDTLDTVEAEKKAQKIQRILNAQQHYKLLSLGLSEVSRDFNNLKKQVSVMNMASARLPEVLQLDRDFSLKQRTYLQLYENLQQSIELAPLSVSSIAVSDSELRANLNQLERHCEGYATLVEQTEKKINEASTAEEQLAAYQHGIDQLKEYSSQYAQYRQKVQDRVHALELIENDYNKALVNKNSAIAHVKKILESSELQQSLKLMNSSDHSLQELIVTLEKQVTAVENKKYLDVHDQLELNNATQQCQRDNEVLDFLTQKLNEKIVEIQRYQGQHELEQIVAIQKEFDIIYNDIKSTLAEAFLELDEINLIKSQFDQVRLESNTTKQNQLTFTTEKVKRLRDIISQLNRELPEQKNRVIKKNLFDIKFIKKGIILQQTEIIEKIKTSHFKFNSLEQEVFDTILKYQMNITENENLSLAQLNKQLKNIKEQHRTFTKAYNTLQGIVVIHSAVKNLFRQDKTLTIDTFIEATNSSIYGGQLLITLAQYINKEQLVRIIEKNLDRFNDKGMVAINEFIHLTNVSST